MLILSDIIGANPGGLLLQTPPGEVQTDLWALLTSYKAWPTRYNALLGGLCKYILGDPGGGGLVHLYHPGGIPLVHLQPGGIRPTHL